MTTAKELQREMTPAGAAAPLRARATPIVALACAAEALLPGAGYAVLGKWGRAATALVGVAFLFAWGLRLDGSLDRPEGGQILSALATFACMGVGPAYFFVTGSDALQRGLGDPTSATEEYGTTFLRAAGLIGYLLLLDVFDVAVGRKA